MHGILLYIRQEDFLICSEEGSLALLTRIWRAIYKFQCMWPTSLVPHRRQGALFLLLSPLPNERGTGGVPQGETGLRRHVEGVEGVVDGLFGGPGLSQARACLERGVRGRLDQPRVIYHLVQRQSQRSVDCEEAGDEILGLFADALPLGAGQVELSRSDTLHNVLRRHALGVEGSKSAKQGILEGKEGGLLSLFMSKKEEEGHWSLTSITPRLQRSQASV